MDLDEDRRRVRDDLRIACRRSGLSQARFAVHLGTSASRLSTYLRGSTTPSAALYVRAHRVADALDQLRGRGRMTPDDVADAVDRALRDGDEDFALRMVLQGRDDVRAELTTGGPVRLVWARRTRRCLDERFDVLLRAVTEHELSPDPPLWAAGARLDDEWVVADPFRDEAAIRRLTPDWLAQAGILLADRALVTV